MSGAVRIGDPVSGGGKLEAGSPDTQIGSRAASRYGDPADGGRVSSGSSTVFINGVAAARTGDFVRGVRHVERPDGTHEKAYYVEARSGSVGAGVLSLRVKGESPLSPTSELGMGLEVASASASLEASGLRGQAAARFVEVDATSRWAPLGDPKNPLADSRYHAEVLETDGRWSFLAGEDGEGRKGAGFEVEAGAATVEAGAVVEYAIPLWPGSSSTVSVRRETEVSAGAAAAGAGAMAFYDSAERRFHLVGLVRFAWGIGARRRWDISIGRKLGAPVAPPDPEPSRSVGRGSPTVHIGD